MKLTEETLTEAEMTTWFEMISMLSSDDIGRAHEMLYSAIAEIRRHRSALAADRERVRSVVERAAAGVLGPNGPLGFHSWDVLAHLIATRAAEQLATVRPVLTDDERKQLEHHIRDHRVTCSYSCSIIERLMNRPATEVGLSEEDKALLFQIRDAQASALLSIGHLNEDVAANLTAKIALLNRLLGSSK